MEVRIELKMRCFAKSAVKIKREKFEKFVFLFFNILTRTIVLNFNPKTRSSLLDLMDAPVKRE